MHIAGKGIEAYSQTADVINFTLSWSISKSTLRVLFSMCVSTIPPFSVRCCHSDHSVWARTGTQYEKQYSSSNNMASTWHL